MRLPENLRWKEAAVKTRIYDICRLKNRNRKQEAANRAEKEKAGIPIKKRKTKAANKENEQVQVETLPPPINLIDLLTQIAQTQAPVVQNMNK